MERYYFHAEVEGYSRKLRRIIIIVIAPILTVCVFCAVNIVLGFSSDFARLSMWVIAFAVLAGMIFTFTAAYLTDKYKRRHSRYTFFDILPSGLVYSEYAGEFTRYGKRVILRRLYYAPFKGLESISRDPKKSTRELVIKGEIREYFEETNRLGYHVTEDGELIFDTLILNTNYFKSVDTLTIRERLGNTKRIERAALHYWEEFKKIPDKPPFDITKAIAVRKRKKLKTSNAKLEQPSYSRNWK